MTTKKHKAKAQLELPTKVTPAIVVISEARDSLKRIKDHLGAIDALLAKLGDEDDWGHALGSAVVAVESEVTAVLERLGRMEVDSAGNLVGVEEGGVQ